MRSPSPIRFGDLQSVLRVRKWTILGITAVVLGAAVFLSVRQVPVYDSQASVLVRPIAAGEISPQEANMATEKQLAESAAVADLVRRTLGLSISTDALLDGLSIGVPVDTEILEFHYVHPRPEEAQRRAQGFADGYLAYRREQVVRDLLAAEVSIQGRINALNERLATVQEEAEAETDPAQQDVLRAEINSLITQIGILQQELAALSPSGEVSSGEIVERAAVPTSPARPDHLVNGALGLVVGLILGLGAAVLRDYLDDRIRDRQELEAHLGAPVLGTIPSVSGLKVPQDDLVVAVPDSPAAEAFRRLRTNLLFAATQSDSKTILVTSAREREGKTLTAANLGAALATAGKKVILVSADLRRPRLEDVFDLSASVGLVDVLMDLSSPRSTLQQSGIENLLVLASGPIPSNPAELLGSVPMSTLLADLREMADFVVVDSAPLLPVTDAAVLVPFCDAVLFVSDSRSATRRAIREARRQLEAVDARLIGGVLMNASLDSIGTYGYYRRP